MAAESLSAVSGLPPAPAAPPAGPAGRPVINAVGLTKVFRDFWGRPKAAAVNGIDFAVHPGEVLGFLGPNGSGKSTTVKLLLGLLYPTAGGLSVFGQVPTDVQTKKRIGYLPEETYLYKYLTAAETLDFFGALFNLPPDVRRTRTRQLLEQVGLTHAAHRPVGEFSKGMARRIGLAQALVNDPDLVILDEPTSGLDPIGCMEVKEIIRLLARRKKTVILCSHLLADVEDVCDTVLIMYGGRIRARGPLKALLTVEDKTRIIAPALTPATLARVMAILNEAAPAGSVSVDQPTVNLEDFFLDVVQKARAETIETAGVVAGGKIADFLAAGETAKSGLERLAELAHAPAAEPPAPVPVAPPPAPADVAKLKGLAQSEPPAPPPAPTAPPAPAAAAELTAAEKAERNRRLQELLGKKS